VSNTLLRFEGLSELRARLQKMTATMTQEEAGPLLLRVARAIQREARARAPHFVRTGVPKKYERKGMLRDAIIAWQKRRGVARALYGDNKSAAFVKVNYSPKLRAFAPHAHFTEFGTKERLPKKKARLLWPPAGGGRWIAARRTRGVAARPYFRPAVTGAGYAELDAIAAEMARRVEAE